MSGSIKQSAEAPLKVSQLEADIKSGKIDTVVVGVDAVGTWAAGEGEIADGVA